MHDTEIEQNTLSLGFLQVCGFGGCDYEPHRFKTKKNSVPKLLPSFCVPIDLCSNSLDVLNEFRIEIGESIELRLVEIHHEELVGWC